MNRAVFLDRDNTIVCQNDDLGDPEKVRLFRGAAHAIGSLHQLGYLIVVVSNQGGVARGQYTEADVDAVHQRIAEQVRAGGGGVIDRFYYCPFHPEGNVKEYAREHPWRKPQPGMLLQAVEDLELDPAHCWMVGDQERDVEAGRSAGCHSILLTDRPDVQTSADFQAATLAEAAAIIAQNHGRAFDDHELTVVEVARTVQQHSAGIVRTSTSRHFDQHSPLPGEAIIDDSGATNGGYDGQSSPLTTVATLVEADEESTPVIEVGRDLNSAAGEPMRSAVTSPAQQSAEERSPIRPTGSVAQATPQKIAKPSARGQSAGLGSSAGDREDPGVKSSPIGMEVPDNDAPRSSLPEADRTAHLLGDIVGEVRSWRQSVREFTPIKMFLSLTMIGLFIAAVGIAIYLEPAQAVPWIATTAVGQLLAIGLLIINQRS